MNIRNHVLAHRPLVGGIAIFNRQVNVIGTAGLIASTVGIPDDRWLVSCYHVLARSDLSPFVVGEEIFQPWGAPGSGEAIAHLEAGDSTLDCAAARIIAGVGSKAHALGIGPLAAPVDPAPGMRVLKSGIATGVTEGVVDAVAGDQVTIRTGGLPPKYDLADIGDSGAVWVTMDTRAPVALHRATVQGVAEAAIATKLSSVLHALGLEHPS